MRKHLKTEAWRRAIRPFGGTRPRRLRLDSLSKTSLLLDSTGANSLAQPTLTETALAKFGGPVVSKFTRSHFHDVMSRALPGTLAHGFKPGLLPPTRQPITIDPCFGWLHAPRATGGEVAVLICAGLNHDLLNAHHALRVLADELAGAGYPTLRIDYPGISDSADPPGDDATPAEHWSSWQSSLHAALDWLREASGARHLVLCGLRFGAALATHIAEQRDDVTALILLAPIFRGRYYMRQLQMEARLSPKTVAPPSSTLDFNGLQFSAETIDHISRLDLRAAQLAAGAEVAMFEQSASKHGDECTEAWRERGVRVFRPGFAGLEPVLRNNEENVGAADFSAVLDWLRGTLPARPIAPARIVRPEPRLARPGWVETPERFGQDDRLFGILCRPDDPGNDLADMTVLIVNTGADPHYGVSRFGVEFARHLASLGVSSLRIDFTGLGDSLGPPGKETAQTPVYGIDRSVDISAALDRLAQLGYGRFAIHGNCSGAYHAFRGALADPRISVLLLLNLPAFGERDGDTGDVMRIRTTKPIRYLRSAVRRKAWRQLLRNPVRARSIIGAQWGRLCEQIGGSTFRLTHPSERIRPQGIGHNEMQSLAVRGARTLFLYASDDTGLDAMELAFGRDAAGLRKFQGAVLRTTPQINHLLTTLAMRRTAAQLLGQFLTDLPQTPETLARRC